MKYAFFPGCSLESTAWDFDKSTRAMCQALDIELTDIPDWTCCGSTPAHSSNASLATALPAMNLQKAREMGLEVMAACASCYARLRTANHKVKTDEQERERVKTITGAAYAGETPVRHVLDVLVNEYTVERVRSRISKPLSGLRVASYYGCLLSRPPEVVAFDNPEHPTCMDELIDAAGGEPVDWPYKTECCGASLSLSNANIVGRLSHRLLAMAVEAGADCIAVACPLCQMNLDMRQADANAHGKLPPTPALYITQLLGLALGLKPDDLGLNALTINANAVLKKISSGERRSAQAGAAR
ncbi:CoB--CoM heterodisulfide reductase iron-sulfur subunit B family protein [Candidatus Sumerlaeota bacterium]|nr:CoB--CoM heterodisulfide reductase iron-sulfur subunit B family protein [Candidatus Sumerlaeota bacterium]